MLIASGDLLKNVKDDFLKMENVVFLTDLVESPVPSLCVTNELAKDPIISRVIHYVQFGWPTEKTFSPALNLRKIVN